MTTALPECYNVLHYMASLLIRGYDKQYLPKISFNKTFLTIYWCHGFKIISYISFLFVCL
jgi:hypothetical protein